MSETKYCWLNEFGSRYWHKNSDITKTAHRSYHWVDRVTFIHESRVDQYNNKLTTSGRQYIGETTYTLFKMDINNWTPIEDFDKYTIMLSEYYKKNEKNER